MKTLKEYLKIDEGLLNHFKDLRTRYRKLYETPQDCQPMIIVDTSPNLPCGEELFFDPAVGLRRELDVLRPHFEMRDDYVPCVRVNFGTAQVAAAYGCELYIPANSTPAASSHVLTRIEDAFDLKVPDINAGWYGKLHEWTEMWLDALPEGIEIQHPDIQSPFNSAHLIRGNDIFTDFYDNPKALDALLANVTDFMIKLTPVLKNKISSDTKYFYDWGCMWAGAARISNCTMHLIAPELYINHVMKHDKRFFEAGGGGRIHYCGENRKMAELFFSLEKVSGCDASPPYKDAPFEVCSAIPPNKVPFIPIGRRNSEVCKSILNGNLPEKRNIILRAYAPDTESGKALLNDLRSIFLKRQ